MMYLLTAIGLSPGGSNTIEYSTVQYTFTHIQYTERHKKAIHRTTQQFGRVRAVLG